MNEYSSISETDLQLDSQEQSITPRTRFFEVSVDPLEDDLNLMAFSSFIEDSEVVTRKIAVNGHFDCVDSLFSKLFIWKLSRVQELAQPAHFEPREWLVVNAEQA